MTMLVRYTGPGVLSVKDVEGVNRDLRSGQTARVADLTKRQKDAGLREIGADLGARDVTRDVLERELGDMRHGIDALTEQLDEVIAELRVAIVERDGALERASRLVERIGQLERDLAERDERIERLGSLLADTEVVDKPWLDATKPVLQALVAVLEGELGGQARKAELLAWLYTQRQQAVAKAFAALDVGTDG